MHKTLNLCSLLLLAQSRRLNEGDLSQRLNEWTDDLRDRSPLLYRLSDQAQRVQIVRFLVTLFLSPCVGPFIRVLKADAHIHLLGVNLLPL